MTDDNMQELDIPDGARAAQEAVEVLRAFIGDGALHVNFDPETFRHVVPQARFQHDVSGWGRLHSDVAHHVAKAVAMDGQMSHEDALSAVHAAFDRGIGNNPVAVSGQIKGRVKH